jgi:DNA-binding PadR family transcriptional regulator
MIRYIDQQPPEEGNSMLDWHAEFGKSLAKADKLFRKARGPFGRPPGFGDLRRGGPHGGIRRGFGEAERGSIKYDILGILWDGPRHGYDIMRTIEEQRGFRPSPGSIYPALQMLEEGDFLTGNDIDGKRVYTITDKGSELLAKHRETADGSPASEVEMSHAALFQRGMQTMIGLKMVLKEIARTRNPKMYAKALTIIEHARRDLYEILTAE